MAKSMRHEALAYTKIGRNALLRDIKNANSQLKTIKHENESLRRDLQDSKLKKKQASQDRQELGTKAEKDKEIFQAMFQQDKDKYCKQIIQLKGQVTQLEHDKLELQKAFAVVQHNYLKCLTSLQEKIAEVKLEGVEEALEDDYKLMEDDLINRQRNTAEVDVSTVGDVAGAVNSEHHQSARLSEIRAKSSK
mmetsp:Transcript_32260/g.36589  ORF Transcript_32260/g.36589 Transcript_32260/m.36589 type:complete len:192 (-) Transcript_32260:357-932(-)